MSSSPPTIESLLIALLVVSAIGIVIGAIGGIRLVTGGLSGASSRTSLVAAASGFGVALVMMAIALIIGMTHLFVVAAPA